MDSATQVQILNEAVCFLSCANTLRKGMNPTIFPSAMDKIVGQTGLFKLGVAASLGEGKL